MLTAALCAVRTLSVCTPRTPWQRPFAALMSGGAFNGPRQQEITQKLTDVFRPAHLEVINTSHGRIEDESHFKVVVVSDVFEGKRLVGRHQLVNKALMEDDGSLGFRARRSRENRASRRAPRLAHLPPRNPCGRFARNWRHEDAGRVGHQQRRSRVAQVHGRRRQRNVAVRWAQMLLHLLLGQRSLRADARGFEANNPCLFWRKTGACEREQIISATHLGPRASPTVVRHRAG
jgi:stress-induced morphogen